MANNNSTTSTSSTSSTSSPYYRTKEKDPNKIQPVVQLEESERVKLEKEACDRKDLVYPDTFYNQKEREFLHFKKLFPDTYYMWIDQVWRLLDERDGQEYIMYHAYQYVTQTITQPDGRSVKRNHSIDGYYGFWHDPQVKVKEFNPDGSVAKQDIEVLSKVYTIPWSKKTFDELIDSKDNKGITTNFILGIASTDASRDVPIEGTAQTIRNREDFSSYDFDETMNLAKSKLSTSVPSMAEVQKILELRKRLAEPAKAEPKMAVVNANDDEDEPSTSSKAQGSNNSKGK